MLIKGASSFNTVVRALKLDVRHTLHFKCNLKCVHVLVLRTSHLCSTPMDFYSGMSSHNDIREQSDHMTDTIVGLIDYNKIK